MKINLLPDLVVKRRHEAEVKRIANLALIGWLGAVALVVVLSLGYKAFATLTLNSAKQKHEEVNARVNSEENVAFRKEALEVQASLDELHKLFNGQNKLSAVMQLLASATPQGVRLNDVILGEEGVVAVSGVAGTYEDAGKLIVAMRNAGNKSEAKANFDEVTLNGASKSDQGVAFSIRAKYSQVKAEVTQ